MPAELLRDVTQAGRSIPTRRLSVLPLSIAAHVGVAIVFLLIPLAAEVELPVPMPRVLTDYMSAKPVPPPPPPAPSAMRAGVQRQTGAPIAAPPAIIAEREHPPAPSAPTGLEVVGGLDTGVGYSGGLGAAIAVDPPAPPAVKPPVPPVPVRPGGKIREPNKIFDVAPVYPPLARSGQVEGVVILEAVISVRGEVERVRVLRSMPLLDAAAIDAVQRWRYTPTLLNGIPVPVLITVTVHFTLR